MKVSIFTVLFIVFTVLKLTGDIQWSWIWVFAPLWFPIPLAFISFFIIIMFMPERADSIRAKIRAKRNAKK